MSYFLSSSFFSFSLAKRESFSAFNTDFLLFRGTELLFFIVDFTSSSVAFSDGLLLIGSSLASYATLSKRMGGDAGEGYIYRMESASLSTFYRYCESKELESSE